MFGIHQSNEQNHQSRKHQKWSWMIVRWHVAAQYYEQVFHYYCYYLLNEVGSCCSCLHLSHCCKRCHYSLILMLKSSYRLPSTVAIFIHKWCQFDLICIGKRNKYIYFIKLKLSKFMWYRNLPGHDCACVSLPISLALESLWSSNRHRSKMMQPETVLLWTALNLLDGYRLIKFFVATKHSI